MSQKKVWLVTGCSTGFGRELALRLIEEGYPVVVTARNPDTLNELADGREDQVLPLRLDVTDARQIEDAVAAASAKFGRIDVLVNNAGIGYFASVEESLEDETRKMFEINFWGLMRMTRAVLPLMREQQSGHILNFSSIGGLASFPALGYYHATKYAVEGISESLAQEVASSGIKVTIVEPSGFRTDWGGRSSAKTPTAIPAYEATAGQVIASTEHAGSEPGDPAKAAEALITVAELEQPPLRLLLGQAAYHVATNKFNTLLQSIEEWKDTTIGADFAE